MRIWVRFRASCKSAAAEALVLGVSIINKPQRIQSSRRIQAFCPPPFSLSSHFLQLWVIPQLWSPFLNRRHPAGGLLAWTLACDSRCALGPCSLGGDAAARRVWAVLM